MPSFIESVKSIQKIVGVDPSGAVDNVTVTAVLNTLSPRDPYRLSPRSRSRLVGVHPDLVLLAGRAIQLSPIEFQITEGLRDSARQRRLVDQGASWTMDSRHLTGDAIDVVAYLDGEVSWHFGLYTTIAAAFAEASVELAIPVKWGGDWKSKDGVHFERPRE